MKHDDIVKVLNQTQTVVQKADALLDAMKPLGQVKDAVILLATKLNTLQSDVDKIKTKLGI